VQDGLPMTEDDRLLDVNVIVWATGYRYNYQWIDLDLALDEYGVPHHYRGVIENEPGLYFMGIIGLYRGKSPLICGVSEDGQYIAHQIANRSAQLASTNEIQSFQQQERQTA
jgi:putative flavoprotein involved in K+ transport